MVGRQQQSAGGRGILLAHLDQGWNRLRAAAGFHGRLDRRGNDLLPSQGQSGLDDALLFNRKLWSVFLSEMTDSKNPMPKDVRQNVANLGLFVMNHTIQIQASPAADKLDVLIAINRQLAAGLRAAQQ